MGPEGEVRDVVSLSSRHLDQDRRVVDVGVGHRDPELDVAAAPPPAGADQDELVPGKDLVQPADSPPDAAQRLEVAERRIPLGVDVDDVRDRRDPSVRDEPVRGEDDVLGRDVAGDHRRVAVVRKALRPALQEVEVLPVGGELEVDRAAQLLLEEPQERADLRHELRAGDEPLEGDDEVLRLRLVVDHHRPVDPSVLEDGDHVLDAGETPSRLAKERFHLHRLEPSRLEVDDVGAARRVADDLVGRHVHAQPRLAGGDEDRVVVADPVDGARPEPRNEPDEAVLAPDPRRPAELVVREGDAGERREKVPPDARADDLLDHDPHLLVDVEETALGAVLDRVGAEDRGVDLGNGVHERRETLLLRTLVREEEALVLAGERGPDAVLEEARAADDDRPLLEVVEGDGQTLQDLRGEVAVLEDLDDVRVLSPHLVDLEVLAVVRGPRGGCTR